MWLPLFLEPDLDFGQYLKELSPKNMGVFVVQRGHRLEMNEKLLEIERDLDTLGFQYISELGCTCADRYFVKNNDSVN